ncbi:hypothetical protein LBMAG42_34220 [Deltaproteobacteria bacterium]|nr:hypothetical protein LBMAG42_34220 [Deltaproteobacteria bacterium]
MILTLAAFFASHPALATSGFDPAAPAATFTGSEVEDLEGTVRLWSAIELHQDPDRKLFDAGEYNDVTAWPDDASWAPHIADCFGTGTPHTSAFLLHVGPSAAIASGTPILFVPGAADNGSRGFITMAWHEDLLGRPVYAMTFAHPHGDAFQQAEAIADAIARIKERTGASQVDLVAHSKGGIAASIYTSNFADAAWSDAAYEQVGTVYRGDVRRLVLIATPLAGIDTAFRWPNGNYMSLDANEAYSPASWGEYYPYGTANVWNVTDLGEQDFLPQDGDLFPGQRQLYARQDYDLPGSMPWLGVYAAQQDWSTTYEGGYGFYSYSDGIDAVVEASGGVLDAVAANGVDPAIEVFLLAGNNPVMPNGTPDFASELFGEAWAEIGDLTVNQWADIVAAAISDGLVSVGITEEEVQGLASGALILGEISGESDGLVFLTSATAQERLTARGAVVKDVHVANLSHLDLLYASPITGELLIDAGAADNDDAWMIAFGERHTSEDTIGVVEDWVADADTGGDDTGDTGGDDTASEDSGTDDTAAEDTGGKDHPGDIPGNLPEECGACNGGSGAPVALGVLAALGAVARRRRADHGQYPVVT